VDFTRTRLMKQARLFGREAMEILASERMFIAGCGRNGSAFAILSAYSGFMDFVLADPDSVEPRNLNASIGFSRKDIGRRKVDVVRERLLSLDPSITCETLALHIQDERARKTLASADIVVDATDSIPAKKFLNAVVAENIGKGKDQKLLSLGSGAYAEDGGILQMGAQAVLFEKGGACLLCGPLNREERTNLSDVSLVVVNVLASLLGLQLLLSSLLGYGDRPCNFLLYDCLGHRVVGLQRVGRKDCEYCGLQQSKEKIHG